MHSSSLLQICLGGLACTSTSNGLRLLNSPAELTKREYDFVVAGGGTAGCVLAARLSENPNTSVLLVEAGGDNRDFLSSIIPFYAGRLENTAADWNYTSTPQPGYANRSIPIERGHLLGGSSSVSMFTSFVFSDQIADYMAYNRGSDSVYNRWASQVASPLWSWTNLEKYYLRNSRLVAPSDGRNYSEDVDAGAHGNGPVEVSVAGEPWPLDYKVVEAAKSLGGRFAYNKDLNAGDFVGFTWTQSSIGQGRRSSSATAYLDPLLNSAAKRGNLDVLINTQVTKLLKTGEKEGKPEFRAAQIAQKEGDTPISITARKEIILSAGVYNTPKLLMLSGIGPASHLSSLSILTIVDIPSLGKNLTDHPLATVYFSISKNTTNDPLFRGDVALNAAALAQWNSTGQGPYTDSAGNTQGFLRLPKDSPAWKSVDADPAAGPGSGNTEMLLASGYIPFSGPPPTSGNYITALGVLVSPTSRGSVTLNSSSPFDAPVIDPAYLDTEFDKAAIVQSLRDIWTFLAHPAFADYDPKPYGEAAGLSAESSDEELLEFVRTYGATINHGSATAKMSAKGSDYGVVDANLRVKGVSGLRVVDASIFPEIPECHTQAPVYIVAERAVDIIKDAWSL